MNILVCLKQILDPEMPPRDFRVDAEKLEAQRGAAGLVMNIFCANALETALQFRERVGGKITALSFGDETAEEVLRKALALRVDNAVLVTQDFPSDTEKKSRRAEPMLVSRVLAAAARRLGDFDLILVGREAGDWGEGQTGGLLAEELGWPCVSFAEQLEQSVSDPKILQVRRQTENGVEVLEAASPLVVTVTNHEHNVPRIPKTRDVMMAYRAEVVALTVPQKESHCEFVAGEMLEERVTDFAERIIAVMRSA